MKSTNAQERRRAVLGRIMSVLMFASLGLMPLSPVREFD
jgi:hypothetical protein